MALVRATELVCAQHHLNQCMRAVTVPANCQYRECPLAPLEGVQDTKSYYYCMVFDVRNGLVPLRCQKCQLKAAKLEQPTVR